MKRFLIAFASLVSLSFFSMSASAATPPCNSSVAKGDKCHIGGVSHYACGGGAYVKSTYGSGACNGSSVVNEDGKKVTRRQASKPERTRR